MVAAQSEQGIEPTAGLANAPIDLHQKHIGGFI
jgi:hypothetical protein